MAFQAYISITGKKQGQFKGEALQDKRKDKWISVLSFRSDVTSPRDVATGQASGKRQWHPVVIVKEWGAASPQALQALATNEVLTEVVIEFTRANSNGEVYVYQTVTLTDASVSQVRRFTGDSSSAEGGVSVPPHAMQLDEWSFTFRKIQVEDKDAKTMFNDDWAEMA